MPARCLFERQRRRGQRRRQAEKVQRRAMGMGGGKKAAALAPWLELALSAGGGPRSSESAKH